MLWEGDMNAPFEQPVRIQPHGLWSLWDMLDIYGRDFFNIEQALAHAEHDLFRYQSDSEDGIFDKSDIRGESIKLALYAISQENYKTELQSIIHHVDKLRKRIEFSHGLLIVKIIDVIEDIIEIKTELRALLNDRHFYYVRTDLYPHYGNPELFGERIANKFRKAASDIEHAGNCVALGESTACVMHLMRAMEAIVRTLSRKLKVTINPKDTWGMILKNMDHGIGNLPEKDVRQKRKKAEWSECRSNLYHVKQAWRDESMHTNRFYDEPEARQILETVRVFTVQLATL
jgi:hypothetical protein